ncbi:hypothetical protein BC826DRAFT_984854 [Russula brevipes]|nr:hypothetical protein BC826DRAFT_984854 [Russula brevipes]
MSSAIIVEALIEASLKEDPKVAVDDFIRCLRHLRFSSYVLVASSALLFYDWGLTATEEFDFLWRRRRITYVRTLFTLARYPALGSSISYLVPLANKLNNITLCLCAVTVISSELIFVMRTWAVWEKSRGVLAFLIFLTIACMVPVIAVGMRAMVMDVVVPFSTLSNVQRCQASVNNRLLFMPLFIIMVFEAVVLALTLYKVLRIRNEIPRQSRTKLLNMLWVDGIVYFILMLLIHLSVLALALGVSDTRAWVGNAQLATVLHSVLSTRIVLHTARAWKQDTVGVGSQSRRTTHPVEIMAFADLSEETTDASVDTESQ